jgi:SAM-dependent methyltransferase
VLDVGCGFGDTTVQIARIVGSTGEAVGVDAAKRFIEAARAEADAAKIANAKYLVADVQTDPLGGPYDRAFARFGTMFFASPVAAFRNIKRSLVPGGLLTMVVWRAKTENPMFYDSERCALSFVTVPEDTKDPTCGPGPFSMSRPDVVSDQLKAAGFDRITFERLDADVRIGINVDDAIDFAMMLGPAGEVLRLAGADAEKKRPAIIAAMRELITPLAREGGVYAGSSTWIVSARAA